MNIDGQTVDHLCRNRACVNQMHIMTCSRGENSRRMMSEAWQRVAADLIAQQNKEAQE
ncbi:hypothetical protein [Dactylosporangium sp. NBC_01737]|uniref:hypothetical protein n=1 Tax=Dactylosporangium sp. NBC_01737 TaxID=2975959 RepID=UPI003FA3C69C